MQARIRPLILCGGSGSRLWPVSRDTMPKQFVVLNGNKSPFQETVLRVADRSIYALPIVVTSEAHRFEVERQLAEIEMSATIVLEPERRDSAPAILAGCLLAAADGLDETVAIMASDHSIGDIDAFHASMLAAEAAARSGSIVTFGMKPTQPTTAYGYIEPGEAIAPGVHAVRRFAEKPNAETAATYIASGHLWNSGNLLTRPETMIAEFRRLRPDTFEAVSQALAAAKRMPGAILLNKAHYGKAERLSIDYAVMEDTVMAAVTPADWNWSDIGTWQALWEIGSQDSDGNVCIGETENLGSQNCYVQSRGRITSVVGAQDLIVIVEPDAVLVADRSRSGDVKLLVDNLSKKGVPQAISHQRCHRPWGWYEVRDLGENFQVKRIAVYPGGRLSLQSHKFRSEHWIVVTGTARVTIDDEVLTLVAKQHAEIPLGAIHRLENAGNSLLEIVEVQNGTYLGEDDIVRYEDIYDRVAAE